MRALPAVAALGAALSLAACAYIERERPVYRDRPAAVQTVPPAVVAPGPTVVTPGVAPAAPPAAVIVR
jgi:hypothetical protein